MASTKERPNGILYTKDTPTKYMQINLAPTLKNCITLLRKFVQTPTDHQPIIYVKTKLAGKRDE